MELVLVLSAGALAVLTFAAALGMIAVADNAFASRLARQALASRAPKGGGRDARLRERLEWLGAQAGKGSLSGARRETLRLKMIRAGFYAERAAEAFYGVRVLTALGAGLIAILVAVVLRTPGSPMLLLAVLGAVAAGLFLPNLLLASRIRDRAQAVKIGLPDAVDLMVVCVEAGGTLSSAMQRVAQEFGQLHPVLAEQFRLTLLEMQAGSSRAEALGRLSERTPVDELRSLATLLVQSEALGASIGDTMRAFADQMRRTRYLDAERRAAELPVKMAFPLVLGIFPALAVVIFTPVLIRFVRVLFQVGEP